jgi:hypothetical protein
MTDIKPANAEMVEGYMDGYNPDAPEPSANRSYSYRHGFAVARAERHGKAPLADYDTLTAMADAAMRADEAR